VLILGERINATRKRIGRAVAERDADFIAQEARKQAQAGATHIDCNAGRDPAREVEDLKWMVSVVQDAVDLPLAIDTANPKAVSAALQLVKKPPIINSVTADQGRMEAILPLVQDHGALLVGLCMGEGAMPEGAAQRIQAAERILREAQRYAISADRIYFDPVIVPVSTRPAEALAAVEAVRHIMKEFPGAHTVCGLSNISFGLPHRNTLNRTYLAMMMLAGLDGVIMDPTEPHMMSTVLASRVLLGQDEWCMDYIQASRADRLD